MQEGLVYLPEIKQNELRAAGVLQQNEVAIKIADITIAENVLTGERRTLSLPSSTNEGRRILRG